MPGGSIRSCWTIWARRRRRICCRSRRCCLSSGCRWTPTPATSGCKRCTPWPPPAKGRQTPNRRCPMNAGGRTPPEPNRRRWWWPPSGRRCGSFRRRNCWPGGIRRCPATGCCGWATGCASTGRWRIGRRWATAGSRWWNRPASSATGGASSTSIRPTATCRCGWNSSTMKSTPSATSIRPRSGRCARRRRCRRYRRGSNCPAWPTPGRWRRRWRRWTLRAATMRCGNASRKSWRR